MKAKFTNAIKCFEEGEVNFSLGTLEHALDKTKSKELGGADLELCRLEIVKAVELLKSSLTVLLNETDHDYQNLVGLQIEGENEPEIDDYKLDQQEEIKGVR